MNYRLGGEAVKPTGWIEHVKFAAEFDEIPRRKDGLLEFNVKFSDITTL